MDKEMVVEQENREAKVENGTVAEPSTIDNEDQPMAEIDTQDDSQADNGGSVPDDLANVDTSPPADHFIDEIYDRNTGRRIDRVRSPRHSLPIVEHYLLAYSKDGKTSNDTNGSSKMSCHEPNYILHSIRHHQFKEKKKVNQKKH
ncbi:jg22358 [Pararge aegeria aegeria]|uniref:Jg22358 protein n=1 Tax=Pararge aegeria aegeria TaxID=348720 RepID=A0A8S4QFN2_9NEOP|nr:jg22358 [Pararge aegeria aegeria]